MFSSLHKPLNNSTKPSSNASFARFFLYSYTSSQCNNLFIFLLTSPSETSWFIFEHNSFVSQFEYSIINFPNSSLFSLFMSILSIHPSFSVPSNRQSILSLYQLTANLIFSSMHSILHFNKSSLRYFSDGVFLVSLTIFKKWKVKYKSNL